MAVLLKRRTARGLQELLARPEGANLARDGFMPRDLDGGSEAGLWSFSCALSSPEVTISDGRIRFADTSYTVSDPLPQTLTGATEWVYVWHEKDHSSSGFGHSATEPLSNGNRWIWPLCYYEAIAGVWYLKTILYRGDINVYLPLR